MPTICEYDRMKIQKLEITVIKAEVIGPYIMDLTFSNGAAKRVNLEPWLFGEIFEPLQDPAFFAKMRLEPGDITISWPNGADLAPKFLYELEPEKVIPTLEFKQKVSIMK